MRVGVIFLFLFALACEPKDVNIVEVKEDIEINVPSNYITAGNAISIQIINPDNYIGKAQLLVESAVSKKVIDFEISQKNQDLDLDGSFTRDAGLCNFILIVRSQLKDQKTLLIKASDVISPIELFTGPNTIWVNDIQQSMIVSLPKDRFINAGREGDSVLFQVRYPEGSLEVDFTEIQNQLAYKKLESKNTSGKVFIGTSDDESGAKEQRIDVISLWPTDISIEIIDLIPYADNRQFYKLSTDVLRDRNGEIVADGTLIQFKVRHNNKSVSYNAYTIDGVSNVYIRNPSHASRWFAKAVIGDQVIVSNTVTLDFKSNIKNIPVEIINDAIIVGPIASYIGQFIPDGTEVKLIGDDIELNKESEDGMVKFERPQMGKDLMISVGGVTKKISDVQN